jgi:hypothetical protein
MSASESAFTLEERERFMRRAIVLSRKAGLDLKCGGAHASSRPPRPDPRPDLVPPPHPAPPAQASLVP